MDNDYDERAAIKFFIMDIKRMASALDAQMMPNVWQRIMNAHMALSELLAFNYGPNIPPPSRVKD